MRKKGFSVIFIVITLFVLVGVGIWFMADRGISFAGLSKSSRLACESSPRTREFNRKPYYIGPLIDSHVHLPTSSKVVSSVAQQNGLELPIFTGELTIDKLACLFEAEGVTGVFGFHINSKFAQGAAVNTAKEIEKKYPGKFVHFLMPPPVAQLNVSPSEVGETLAKNKGLFGGFGEVALYMDAYQGAKPNDPDFLEIYKLADEHNLIVMIHPEDNDKTGIEEILQKFPNVTFFFHGGHYQKWIIGLMDDFDNFYYSVDAEINLLYGQNKGPESTQPTKEEYLSYARENFDSIINETLREWKEIIEANPDRFTWGTDRWYAWHFDPEVSVVVEELSRSFIGGLDSSAQEAFAYKNAEKILEEK